MAANACARHARREAVASCSSCGHPMCRDCANPTGVGFKCQDCSGHTAAHPWSTRVPRRAVAIGAGVALLAVVLVVAWPDGRAGPLSDAAVGLPEQVRFTSADGTELTGLVDLPGSGGPHPGVLVVGGFGQTTAVGVGSGGGRADPLYRDLGTALSDAGLTVLRYDKRWLGDGTEDDPLTYDDRLADATAALAHLRARPGVDPDRVAVLGHGEGALVALQLARADADVAALSLLNPWGRPLVDVLATEFTRDLPPDEDPEAHEELAETLRDHVDALVATGTVPDRQELPEVLRQVFPVELDAYLRELFTIDPARQAAGVSAPTLLVHGALDPCVQAQEDVTRLQAVMDGPAQVDVLTRPDAGHTLLLDQPTGGTQPDHDMDGTGGQGGTAAERDHEAVTEIADWLGATLAAG